MKQVALALLMAAALSNAAVADEESDEKILQRAVSHAVAEVSPCIVRIDTLGDLSKGFKAPKSAREKGKGVLVRKGFKQAYGPSTGVIISPDGYILTSLFTLSRKPRHIFVSCHDGRQFVAKLAGKDESRGLALLKVEVERALPVPRISPKASLKSGMFSIALGRGYGAKEVNVAVGILSAKDRVSGKALQSSALISPANYGGALAGIDGRVMGLIVPLDASGRLAGVKFYDSGIGFAIPLSDLVKVLPRLMAGETLQPGFLGVQADQTKVRGGIVIKKVIRRSPAAKAKLKAGDRVTHVDGRRVRSFFDLHFALGSKVAGEEVVIKYLRDGVQREARAKLAPRTQKVGENPFGVAPEGSPGGKEMPGGGAPGGGEKEHKKGGDHKGHDHEGHDHD